MKSVRNCYKCTSEHVIKQVLCVENPSVDGMSQRRGRCTNSLPEGECISQGPRKKWHPCRSRHWPDKHRGTPGRAQPPSRDLSPGEPPALPQPAVPLQVFSALFLSALLLLAVRTENFYGVYKPEVTQLNETICHIKFTSARIKRQIT